jgi:hypothetical protein
MPKSPASLLCLESIRQAENQSDLFVLFASRSSLDSLWLRFEIDEAEELLRSNVMKSALVLILDGVTRPNDLAKCMQRSLIEFATPPSTCAREIQHRLNRLRGLEPNPLFIGRDALLSEVSEKLIPEPETEPPHVIVVGGLSGIGPSRRDTHPLHGISLRVKSSKNLRRT